MEEYKTTSLFNVNGGFIGLTDKQALVRKTKLKTVGGGVYEVLSPIVFKVGEVIKLTPTKNDRYIEMNTKRLSNPVVEKAPLQVSKSAVEKIMGKKGNS